MVNRFVVTQWGYFCVYWQRSSFGWYISTHNRRPLDDATNHSAALSNGRAAGARFHIVTISMTFAPSTLRCTQKVISSFIGLHKPAKLLNVYIRNVIPLFRTFIRMLTNKFTAYAVVL